MKKFYLITFIFVIISNLNSQSNDYNWERFSGTWITSNSMANEMRGGALKWNYYNLLDYNTIINSKSFQDYSSISIDAKIIERIQTPSEFMISFAVNSESKSWYYQMYAFKVTGDFWGINKVSFIHSDRIDKTKPYATKNNIFVKEIESAKCSIKYNKMYNYCIVFEDENVVFYLDHKKMLSVKFPEKSHDGRIALSSRNTKISIDKVEVKQKDKEIFKDDFDKDSIYTKTLKVQKAPTDNEVKTE